MILLEKSRSEGGGFLFDSVSGWRFSGYENQKIPIKNNSPGIKKIGKYNSTNLKYNNS